MAAPFRVLLEIGPKGQKVVAGATDWPGLDRAGASEDLALTRLEAYRARYAPVADRAGFGTAFARSTAVEVVERTPGNTSTDRWGIAHVPSDLERAGLAEAELDRRLRLLAAAWATFDDIVAAAPAALTLGPRGGGRSRDEILGHVLGSEAGQFAHRLGVQSTMAELRTPAGLAAHRAAVLDGFRAVQAGGTLRGRWPLAFLLRRMTHHVLDHAWEIEDRTPACG
jgi:hypothetical protein